MPPTIDSDGFVYRKATASDTNGACVQVAANLADELGVVAVRDSKDRMTGPRLLVPTTSWSRFLAGVKAGEIAR